MNVALNHIFILCWCFISLLFGAEDGTNDTYESEIYRPQEALLDKMIADKKVYEIFYQGIQEIFTDSMLNSKKPVDPGEQKQFFRFLLIANKSLTEERISSKKGFAKELSFCQYSLSMVAPNIYESIKFSQIQNLGQLENLFAMIAEISFTEAWDLINNATTADHCVAYDELAEIAKGSPVEEYMKAAFDPALCQVTNETMEKWHQIFDEMNPEHVRYLLAQTFSNDLHVFEFAAVAKAYRPGTYSKHFQKFANSYPIILALYNAIKSTAYTKEEKAMIRDLVADLNQKFPLANDEESRELETTVRVAEIVKNNSEFLNTFSKILLIDNDGTFFDLIIWISQKANFEAQQAKIPLTDQNKNSTLVTDLSTSAATTTIATTTTTTPQSIPSTPQTTIDIFGGGDFNPGLYSPSYNYSKSAKSK